MNSHISIRAFPRFSPSSQVAAVLVPPDASARVGGWSRALACSVAMLRGDSEGLALAGAERDGPREETA